MKLPWRAFALVCLMVAGLTTCGGSRPRAARPRLSPSSTTVPAPHTASTQLSPATGPATTTATTAAAPPPAAPAAYSRAAGTTVGTADYAVPSGAIIVSPSGNDGNAGTGAAPLRSVAAAVKRAAAGGTIVLRAGSYHESVEIPGNKRLTIQSWPKEAVWFDGSVPVTGWAAANGRWHTDGWKAEFDASPTFTRGAKDFTAENWGFINAEHPLAAHPDQVWIGGAAQRQVASLNEVGPGTFFHDRPSDRLYLGSDPSGGEVRASTLQRALMVRSASSVLRGFGVRRYAPSVPDMGAVTLEAAGIEAEHLAIAESATTAMFIAGADTKLRNLHVIRSGLLGLHAKEADRLVAERMLVEHNNVERFNESPSAGGMKLGKTRHATVRDSIFRSNAGTGLWFDVSSYDMTIVGNEMRSNESHGISLEISAKALVANNFITQNRGNGIKVNNTSDVSIWNNTLVGNVRSLWLVQDQRKPSADSADRDKRRPFPDPAMTWRVGPVTLRNNILAGQQSGDCLLCVEDLTKERTAEQMGVTANADIFNRPNPSSPKWVVVWSRGAAKSAVFTSLTAFKEGTGEADTGRSIDGSALVDAEGRLIGTLPSTSSAEPLPAAVAAAVGLPAGTRHYGAWPR